MDKMFDFSVLLYGDGLPVSPNEFLLLNVLNMILGFMPQAVKQISTVTRQSNFLDAAWLAVVCSAEGNSIHTGFLLLEFSHVSTL